ncbi:type II toxin-antitoxin system death-on-curing family toxin [Tabrizicola piscis]|uniref:Type II toxin-antitoxin system death-on-curing family toxin n=1 Tax=Tabrizicola piscis TaxID=2494374 RepID=A0A3S8U455_9RHOB|nr:type II toxin-antitoxin system death-on-curing family toxin [Tabrizicola piscis]AZL58345.1 type II toxin-antitoxin system death-on-curing family toxin [Tabrizicola piscis]
MQLLSPELVEALHDAILNPGELPGRARDKSLEAALARVDNRLAYGMVADAFDLAAAYAMAIARGHCFNDGNKRTAHQSMDTCLDLNGIQITWSAEEVGQIIVRCAQGLVEDGDLADWLRDKAKGSAGG